MMPCWKLYNVTLTYFLKVIKKNYISETVRVSVKMCGSHL